MFNRKTSQTDEKLEVVMEDLLTQMHSDTGDSEGYKYMTDNFVKLYDARTNRARNRISNEAVVTIASNLGVAAIVIAFEQKHVITTKALTFMSKIR